jgi:hypothetical protein
VVHLCVCVCSFRHWIEICRCTQIRSAAAAFSLMTLGEFAHHERATYTWNLVGGERLVRRPRH